LSATFQPAVVLGTEENSRPFEENFRVEREDFPALVTSAADGLVSVGPGL
jgi:hypothetical protein